MIILRVKFNFTQKSNLKFQKNNKKKVITSLIMFFKDLSWAITKLLSEAFSKIGLG
jgi:hypothetical protein